MLSIPAGRAALLLSYDGTPYRGWTDVRDRVLRPVLVKITGEHDLLVEAASRTDAGVHARGQVCSFKHGALRMDRSQLAYSLNQLLPPEVSVLQARSVSPIFDPRSNLGKEYHYDLFTAACRDPLGRLYQWHVPPRRSRPPWDHAAATHAASLLEGCRDFGQFANAPRGSERKRARGSTECRLYHVGLEQLDATSVRFVLRGDRFLYKMVRNIVGVLVRIGYGEMVVQELEEVLAGGRLEGRGVTAPAHGLVLHRVFYGDSDPFAVVDGLELAKCE